MTANIKHVLVTGGAGYIGSHICVELIQAGLTPIVVDNFSNSSPKSLERVEKITNSRLRSYDLDVADKNALSKVFDDHNIDAVIHLAGLKAVGESCQLPLKYYQNNLISTLILLDVMQQFQVEKLVFSSSATVYGEAETMPVTEAFPVSTANPYGRSKLIIEDMLRDVVAASDCFKVALLRYFNPIGAHESGLIGEDPNGIPNNLLPYVTQVAVGKLDKVFVFGYDYPTKDGTGIRDYIHVVDLALGHLKALEKLDSLVSQADCLTYNLGTGKGYSVLDVINGVEQVSGKPLPYQVVARRDGDIAISYADPSLANNELGWYATRELTQMLEDAWRWQQMNFQDYNSTTLKS